MPGMSRKEISRLIDHIEPQGVTHTRTTKGLLLRLPDDTTTMLHFTGSDVRESKNIRARLKRAGVTWPGDQPTTALPDYIIQSRPQKRTLEEIERVLSTWEQRYITGSQLRRLVAAAGGPAGMANNTAQSALYHLGYTPVGKSTARKWMRPLDLEPDLLPTADQGPLPQPIPALPEPPEPDEPDELPPAALTPPQAVSDAAEVLETVSQVVTAAGHPVQLSLVHDGVRRAEPPIETTEAQPDEAREFIDTADSWTASPELLPEHMTLAQVWQLLGAFGLSGEVRVWRTDAR